MKKTFSILALLFLAACGPADETCCECMIAQGCVMPTSEGFYLDTCDERYIQDCPGLGICVDICELVVP